MVKNKLELILGILVLGLIALNFPTPTIAQSSTQKHNPNNFQRPVPYTLGSGDRLSITVLDAEEYSGEAIVFVDGTIKLPFIRSIFVEGMTLNQATKAIITEYGRIFKQPLINVSLVDTRPIEVVLSGEINRPGFYLLSLFNPESRRPELRYQTVVDAIIQAGGITLAADIRQVQLRRTIASGSEEIINLNLWEFLQRGESTQNVRLRDGDRIFIPTASKVNQGEIWQLANSNLASNPEKAKNIQVVGEVNRPGSYVLVGGDANIEGPGGFATVTWGIRQAGGITTLANIREIILRRVTKTGEEQIIPINLWKLLQSGDLNQDPLLQDGDTIFVPVAEEINPAEVTTIARASFSAATIKVSVVGEIESGGKTLQVPLDTTLNQALLTAGGFNRRSHRDTVELISLNSNGSISQQSIEVDFSLGNGEENNPLLQDNDIIVVRRSGLARFSDTISLINPTGAFIDRTLTIFRILETIDGLTSD